MFTRRKSLINWLFTKVSFIHARTQSFMKTPARFSSPLLIPQSSAAALNNVAHNNPEKPFAIIFDTMVSLLAVVRVNSTVLLFRRILSFEGRGSTFVGPRTIGLVFRENGLLKTVEMQIKKIMPRVTSIRKLS